MKASFVLLRRFDYLFNNVAGSQFFLPGFTAEHSINRSMGYYGKLASPLTITSISTATLGQGPPGHGECVRDCTSEGFNCLYHCPAPSRENDSFGRCIRSCRYSHGLCMFRCNRWGTGNPLA